MSADTGNFTTLGRVGKPVGLSGECRFIPFGDTLSGVSAPYSVWIGTERDRNKMVVSSIKAMGKDLLKISIDGIGDRDALDLLKNQYLYIETERLPKPDEDEFYFHDLEGLDVETESGDSWGGVVAVYNFPTTDAIEIKSNSGEVVMFPFRKETTLSVDLDKRRIVIEKELLEELL